MKAIFLTILLASKTTFAMSNIPGGSYEGKASWKDSRGNQGRYNISIEVENEKVRSTYDYGSNTKVYEFTTKADANGFFKVESNGQVVGNGYCMKVQCHYAAQIGDVELEETLTFWQGRLYRVGSKKVDELTIAWEEATKKMEKK